jgi:hypothetical protein
MKTLVLALLAFISVPTLAFGALYHVTTDDPVIYKDVNGPGKDVVSYGNQGGRLMAWEVVKLNQGAFLNYSRFPFAGGPDSATVCFVAQGGKKVVGVGDSQIHLSQAVVRVALDQGATGALNPICENHKKLISENPEAAKLTGLWKMAK